MRAFCGGRGAGKALAIDTPIPTVTGWKSMGDLVPGDKVFDEIGVPCDVINVSQVWEDRPCYEIEFEDGTKITADAKHEWAAWTDRNKGFFHIRTTEYIFDRLNENRTIEVPYGNHLQIANDDLPLAELMGRRFGCTTSKHVYVSSEGYCDKEYANILRSSYTNRLRFATGFANSALAVDRDGTCLFESYDADSVKFISELFRSIGNKVKTEIRDGKKTISHATISLDRNLFDLGTERYTLCEKYIKRRANKRMRIIAIRPVGSVPVRCIEVNSFDHLFLAGEGMIPTHNSFIGAWDLLTKACRTKHKFFMAVAPTYTVLDDATMKTFLCMAEATGKLVDHNKTKYRVELEGGTEVVFRSAEHPGRLRGPNLSGVWIDEASQCVEEAFNVVIACLREGGKMGWVTATFTPKGTRHWTYKVFGTGQPNTELFTCETKSNPFLPPEFANVISSKYTSAMADQELGGRFVDFDGTMFRREWFYGNTVNSVPAIARRIRYWDKAATKDGGCYTCGVLMVADQDGRFYVEDVRRGQWDTHYRGKIIQATAQEDAIRYGNGMVHIHIEQEPGSAGKDSILADIRMLAGHIVYPDKPSGDKRVRAEPFAAQCGGGNVSFLYNEKTAVWFDDYVEEFLAFPSGPYKDQVDATSGAFNKLTAGSFSKPAVSTSGSGQGSSGNQESGRIIQPGPGLIGLPAGGVLRGMQQHQQGLRGFRPR